MVSYFIPCVTHKTCYHYCSLLSHPSTITSIKRFSATFLAMEPSVYPNWVLHSYTRDGCFLSVCYPSTYSYDLLMKQSYPSMKLSANAPWHRLHSLPVSHSQPSPLSTSTPWWFQHHPKLQFKFYVFIKWNCKSHKVVGFHGVSDSNSAGLLTALREDS